MKFNEHCRLCDNLNIDLQDGITCVVTNQKPNFNKTCLKIQLGEKFEKQLGLILINIEKLNKKKKSIYIQFFLFMTIGCILVLSQWNSISELTLTYSDFIVALTLPLFIIITGFGLCGIAYGILKKYRKETKSVRFDKDRIDKVLDRYEIEYHYNVIFGEKYHGYQDIIVEIKSKSNLLENSKLTYQV